LTKICSLLFCIAKKAWQKKCERNEESRQKNGKQEWPIEGNHFLPNKIKKKSKKALSGYKSSYVGKFSVENKSIISF